MSYKSKALNLLNEQYDKFRGISREESKALNAKLPIKYKEIKDYFIELSTGANAKKIYDEVYRRLDATNLNDIVVDKPVKSKNIKDVKDLVRVVDNLNLKEKLAKQSLVRDVQMNEIQGKRLNEKLYNFKKMIPVDNDGCAIISDEIKGAFRDTVRTYNQHSFFAIRVLLRVKGVNNEYAEWHKLVAETYYRNPQPIYDLIKDKTFGLLHIHAEGYLAYAEAFGILQVKLPTKGGCNKHKTTEKVLELKDGRYVKVINPSYVYNNNCAINCLKYVCSSKERPDIIREKIGLPPKSMIGIDQLKLLSTYFKCTINLYSLTGAFMKVIGDYDKSANIMIGNEHYVVIKDVIEPKVCDKCGKWFAYKHECNKQRMSYFQKQVMKVNTVQCNKKIGKKANIDYTKMVYFDLETFIDDKMKAVPYACGWWSNNEYKVRDKEGCMDDFVGEMIASSGKIICAYNGCRFDFHFLLKQFVKRGVVIDDWIINNGRLMGFSWGGKELKDGIKVGQNKVFDLCQFIQSSLDDAGKDFDLVMKKGAFDHKLMSSFEDCDRNRDAYLPYLQSDVLVLKDLFEKFQGMIYTKFKAHITDFMTLSSLAYGIWTTTNTEVIELVHKKEYDFIVKSVHGGRTYPMAQKYKSTHYDDIVAHKDDITWMKNKHQTIDDYIFNGDKVSLYPTAMKSYPYPVGACRWVELNCWVQGTLALGIYDIDYVPNKTLSIPILPKKKKDGIEWSLRDGSGHYTSVDIENAIQYGYKVYVRNGIVWDKCSHVFDEYIDMTYKIKEENDKNPVLRQIGKLLLNGLYGKMLQRAVFNQKKMCNQYEEVLEFLESCNYQDHVIFGDKIVMVGDAKVENENAYITKPCHLGAFVLAYSRRQMLDTFAAIDPTLSTHIFSYTDTDSLHITNDKYDKLKAKGLIGKKLGMVSNDCKLDGKIVYEICLAPKNYMYQYINSEGEFKTVMKCKGISTKYLEDCFYEDGLEHELQFDNSFKRVSMKPLNIRTSDGVLVTDKKEVECFDIVQVGMKRTFNKTTWAGMELIDGKYYPFVT